MTIVSKAPILTAEQYLADELRRPEKYEFVNGVIYAMGGASANHGIISVNLGGLLNTHLPDECQIFIADMKLSILNKNTECYYYPDILVSCDPTDRDDYYRRSPLLIIEILSPSTERIDRQEKLALYKTIPSVKEIILIAQNTKKLEIYRRSAQWQPEIVIGDETIHLESVGLDISMQQIYNKVQLQEA